jgi:hypothetical protein
MTTMSFLRLPANRLSCYSQDTALAELSESLIETSLGYQPGYQPGDRVGHQATQLLAIRHCLPVQGLHYRSDAYRAAIQSTKPASHCELPMVAATEYESTHQFHIQQRLQHRLTVATARGDQSLVRLLQREIRQAG